jgi:hypothetical protein
MEKLNLRELQLTIPSITMLDARKLMGGDGYQPSEGYNDADGIWQLGEIAGSEATGTYPYDPNEYGPDPHDDVEYDNGADGYEGTNGTQPDVNGEVDNYSPLSTAFATIANMSSSAAYNFIGGNVAYNYNNWPGAFANSCAIKLSYALNVAGFNIPQISGQTMTADINGDGVNENFIYRVSAMIPYLDSALGSGERLSINDLSTLEGRQGIICFGDCNFSDATGHVDLWDGEQVVGSNYSSRCDSIIFWDLTSEPASSSYDGVIEIDPYF